MEKFIVVNLLGEVLAEFDNYGEAEMFADKQINYAYVEQGDE